MSQEPSEPLKENSVFHFCSSTGKDIGTTATNLNNFADKLRVVSLGSINFHFRQGDFQKWLRNSIGDSELADLVDQIDSNLSGEKLRQALIRAIDLRLPPLPQFDSSYNPKDWRVAANVFSLTCPYEATYLGGHSTLSKKLKVSLAVKDSYIEIPELSLRINYPDLLNAQIFSDLKPGVPTGVVGVFLGASRGPLYLHISYRGKEWGGEYVGYEKYVDLEVRPNDADFNRQIRNAILCKKFEFLASSEYTFQLQDIGFAANIYERAAEIASTEQQPIVASLLYKAAGTCYSEINCNEKAIEVYEKAGDNILKEENVIAPDFKSAWEMYMISASKALSSRKLLQAKCLADKAISTIEDEYRKRHTIGHTMGRTPQVLSIIVKHLSEGRFSEAKLFWNEVQKDAGQFFNPIESALKAINEKPFQDETEKNIDRSLKQLPSELRKIQIGDFEIFLNSIGFKTEITEISKGWVDGIITLKNEHIDCIAKYTSTFSAKLVFVIETEAKKVDGINLEIKQKDGKILNLYWASKNKALAAALNNDADLMQKLANGIQKNNSSKWNSSSSTSTVNSDGKEIQKHYVVLSHTVKNLPSKDYFEAINKVAYHIRQVN